jgi:hypothetical protein
MCRLLNGHRLQEIKIQCALQTIIRYSAIHAATLKAGNHRDWVDVLNHPDQIELREGVDVCYFIFIIAICDMYLRAFEIQYVCEANTLELILYRFGNRSRRTIQYRYAIWEQFKRGGIPLAHVPTYSRDQ